VADYDCEYIGFPYWTDLIDPVVSNLTPAAGTTITVSTPLQFDVTDNSGVFRRILLFVQYGSDAEYHLVHHGDGFNADFSNAFNTRTVIANGYRYTILPDGGWPAAPTVTPVAIDIAGHENL
jgi:hypothetical protein